MSELINPRLKPVETLLWCGTELAVGSFECAQASPFFAGSGDLDLCYVGFPETPSVIARSDLQESLASPLVATIYNQGDSYARRKVARFPDHGKWVAMRQETFVRICKQAGLHGTARRHRFMSATAFVSRDEFVAQRLLFSKLRMRRVPDPVAMNLLFDLLLRILSRAEAGTVVGDAASVEFVSPIAEELDCAAQRPCFVQGVGRAAGISARSVHRNFKKRVGATAHQIGMELRARRAFDLLCSSSMALADIAFDLGYSSQSHFCSNFHATFGVNPRRVRDEIGSAAGR